MIDRDRINITHRQFTDSCLLSNYAVASNYCTNIEIIYYFIDYLREFENDFLDLSIFDNPNNTTLFHMRNQFELLVNNNYELNMTKNFIDRYSRILVTHLHIICRSSGCHFTESGIPGLEFIKKLHLYSDQNSYKSTRNIIDLNLYSFSDNNQKYQLNNVINTELHEKECIINVFTNHSTQPFIDMHSYTIYKDKETETIFIHDTRRPHNDREIPENWINFFESGQVLKYLPK